jgi:aminotransferase
MPLPFSQRRALVSAAPVQISPIKAMEIEASRLGDVVSLAQGIPSFDTPEPIKQYVVERLAEGVCARYSLSPGLPELRELISEALLADGMRYDPDGEILVTCGAIEAIASTLLATVGPGDEVIVASPTYASYLPAIRLAGARPRFVALDEDRNFDLDPDAIGAALTSRTRAILLCNPNNPTGTVYSVDETAEMMRLAEEHDLLVITDEVYKDFLYTDEEAGNPAKLEAYRDRVLRVFSFSKAFGMTGWRVGFVHGDRRLVNEILAVHDTLVTCAPVVSQYAAIAALRLGTPFIEQFRREFRDRRDRVVERLDALDRVFDYQMPNASYFAFPRVKDTVPLARDSTALAHDILQKARVALVPGVAFGPTGEAHLRICYARPPQDIERAFDRLDDYFAGHAPRRHALPSAAPAPTATSRLREAGQGTLRALARLRLARQRPRVVAIAGGRGKTVLKRTLTELLREQYRVRSNPLSHNTEIGLAMAILGVRLASKRPADVARTLARSLRHAMTPDAVDILVLELGVRRRGDMRELLSIVCPDVAVITPLAADEGGDLEALQTLQAEMGELIAEMKLHDRPVLVCRDDPRLEATAQTFGVDDYSDGRLTVGGTTWDLARELVGATAVRGMAAAVRTAQLLGVDDERIGRFLAG